MISVWHWLIAQGLFRDLVSSPIAVTLGLASARLVAWRPLKRHTRLQQQIADKLDETTPGGLGTVHQQLREVKRQLDDKDTT